LPFLGLGTLFLKTGKIGNEHVEKVHYVLASHAQAFDVDLFIEYRMAFEDRQA